jgi:hypothetical protein
MGLNQETRKQTMLVARRERALLLIPLALLGLVSANAIPASSQDVALHFRFANYVYRDLARLLTLEPSEEMGANVAHRAFLTVSILLIVLMPSFSNAEEVHKCEGRVATIVGTPSDDTLYGTPGNDVVAGLGGDDIISMGHSWDGLYNHGDLICGHRGSDTIYENCGYSCVSRILGGRGDDRIESSDVGHVWIDGGPGDDILVGHNEDAWGAVVSYASAPGPITANLKTDVATGYGTDTVTGFTDILGSSSDDTLIGDGGANSLYGNGGRDLLYGRGGPDTLHDNDGQVPDEDLLNGGRDDDECHFMGPDTLIACENKNL